MRRAILITGLLGLSFTVAACDTDAERGLVGAGAGAAVSVATGGDPLVGGVLGGAAGVFCDDVGICK